MLSAQYVWAVGEQVTAAKVNANISDNIAAISKAGVYFLVAINAGVYQSPNLIDGWLLECNGAAVSRTTYSALSNFFAALTPAYPFGAGDGSTTFNVPDLSGRSVVSLAPSGGHGDVDTLGDNDGEALASRRPKHKHTYSDPGHDHDVGGGANPNAGGFTYLMGQTTLEGTIPGGNAVRSAQTGITIGPQPSSPTDSPAYLVGGVWCISTGGS